METENLDRRHALGLLAGLGGVVTLGGHRPAGPIGDGPGPAPAPVTAPGPGALAVPAAGSGCGGAARLRQPTRRGTACSAPSKPSWAASPASGARYTSFPFEMFIYGTGGVKGWGTLCGALNGCAAALQLLSRNPGPVIDELFLWYEQTALPNCAAKGIRFKTVHSLAGSPLCHPSIAHWCDAAGLKAYSPERDERCGVLAASVARQCAVLLNAQAAGNVVPPIAVDARTRTCRGCHEKGGVMEDMRAKQTCAACHSDESLSLHGHQKLTLQRVPRQLSARGIPCAVETTCPDRGLRLHHEGPALGQRRPAAGHQGEYGRGGAPDPGGPGWLRPDPALIERLCHV